MSAIISPNELANLTRVDESAMPDTCEVRTRPASGGGGDFGGGDDNDDAAWAVVTYLGTTAIPCRVGTLPRGGGQQATQGALATLYLTIIAIPKALLGSIKPTDHVHWQGHIYEVAEDRTGTYSTSLQLACERIG